MFAENFARLLSKALVGGGGRLVALLLPLRPSSRFSWYGHRDKSKW
jgi:hypothetical protein